MLPLNYACVSCECLCACACTRCRAAQRGGGGRGESRDRCHYAAKKGADTWNSGAFKPRRALLLPRTRRHDLLSSSQPAGVVGVEGGVSRGCRGWLVDRWRRREMDGECFEWKTHLHPSRNFFFFSTCVRALHRRSNGRRKDGGLWEGGENRWRFCRLARNGVSPR